MKKEKSPKRPLIYYYIIVVLCLMLINSLVVPWFAQRQVQLVDYNTFLDMTQQQQIGLVEVQEDQIVFTNKDNTAIYKTGRMEDPALVERLIDSGARFSQEIVEDTFQCHDELAAGLDSGKLVSSLSGFALGTRIAVRTGRVGRAAGQGEHTGSSQNAHQGDKGSSFHGIISFRK